MVCLLARSAIPLLCSIREETNATGSPSLEHFEKFSNSPKFSRTVTANVLDR